MSKGERALTEKEFKQAKKELLSSFEKELPRTITAFFLLIACITIFTLYQWKFLLLPIVIFIVYLILWLILMIVSFRLINKAKIKIEQENDDLDF